MRKGEGRRKGREGEQTGNQKWGNVKISGQVSERRKRVEGKGKRKSERDGERQKGMRREKKKTRTRKGNQGKTRKKKANNKET